MSLILDEGFENPTGCDDPENAIWYEWGLNGADPNYPVASVSGAPEAWGAECAAVSKNINLLKSPKSYFSDLYIRLDFIVASVGLSSGYAVDICNISAVVNSQARLSILYAGVYYLNGYIGAGGFTTMATLAFNRRYRIDMYLLKNGASSMKVDGVQRMTGTCRNEDLGEIMLGDWQHSNVDMAVYFDKIQVSTEDWVPSDPRLSGPMPLFYRR